MTSKKTADFIVIGGGLAGTLLADSLKKKEPSASVVLIDDIRPNVSSRIAAGIFNPITGRLMSLTWKSNELFEFLTHYYSQMEAETGERFFNPLPIHRILQSKGDQNDWIGRSDELAYHRFLRSPEVVYLDGVNNPFGTLHIDGGGWLHVPQFLSAVKKHASFDILHATIPNESNETAFEYLNSLGVSGRELIWSTGYYAASHPQISHLGWSPVRGEILRIKHPNLPSDKILNKGCFILPYGQSEWLLGATYDHNLSLAQTESGKAKLLSRFAQIAAGSPEILEHRWGIRPATKDRRPLIGTIEKGIHLFNGFGSKGVSLTPFFAHQYADHLLSHSTWEDPETNVFRFSE